MRPRLCWGQKPERWVYIQYYFLCIFLYLLYIMPSVFQARTKQKEQEQQQREREMEIQRRLQEEALKARQAQGVTEDAKHEQ